MFTWNRVGERSLNIYMHYEIDEIMKQRMCTYIGEGGIKISCVGLHVHIGKQNRISGSTMCLLGNVKY